MTYHATHGTTTIQDDPRAALLVVDMQVGFADGAPEVHELATRIAAFVERAHDCYGLVAASRFRSAPGAMYQRIVRDDMQREDEVALLPQIAALDLDLVIDSPRYGKLEGELETRMRDLGLDRLHVIGVDTDQCVLATVLAAFDHEIEPLVIADLCTAASGDECHQAGIVALRRAIGEARVVDSGHVLERLGELTAG